MAKKVTLIADHKLLSKDLAALLHHEKLREHYLDVKCGELRVCSCLLAAVSPGFAGETSDAFVALAKAPEHAAAMLLSFVYGDKVEVSDEDQLLELLPLAKKVGVDACVNECRKALGKAADLQFPSTLQMANTDVKQQRDALWNFYSQGRLVDITLRAVPQTAGDVLPDKVELVDFRVHRAILASASAYLSALWAHGFADSHSVDSVIDVDAHPDMVRLLTKGIYGEPMEVDMKELVDLFVLADKWQILSIATPALAQLQQHMTLNFAVEMLKTFPNYPDQIFHAAVVKIAEADEKPKAIKLVSPSFNNEKQGTYQLDVQYTHNNFPTWKQSGGDNVIFKHSSGEWLVGFTKSLSRNAGGIKSRYPDRRQSPIEANGWEVWAGGKWIHQWDVHLSSVEVPGNISDILTANVAFAVRILTGTIAGLPRSVTTNIVALVKMPEYARALVESSAWLGLSVEHMSAVCVALSLDEGGQDILEAGIVVWSRQGAYTSIGAITRIKALCHRYAQVTCGNEGRSAQTVSQASHLLRDLSARCFAACDDVALPAVEEIFIADDNDLSSSDADVPAGKTFDEKTPGQKRRRDEIDQQGAVVDAAIQWASSNLKRLRTSSKWPSARAPVVAAMLKACSKDEVGSDTGKEADQELRAAMFAWAGPASIGSVLKAVRHCDGPVEPKAFRVLLDKAAEKVTTLENVHGGDALRSAQEAQRKAEAESAIAKAEAEAMRSRVDSLQKRAEVAEALAAKEQDKEWVGELQAKASDLLTCINALRPPQDAVRRR